MANLKSEVAAKQTALEKLQAQMAAAQTQLQEADALRVNQASWLCPETLLRLMYQCVV